MSIKQKKLITCPHCHSQREETIYSSINSHDDPAVKQGIMADTLFMYRCPVCGLNARMTYPILYNDIENKFMIYLIPGAEKTQIADRTGEKEFLKLPPITKRIVPTFNEFKEKILILESGLNDMALEITKAAVCEAVTRKTGLEVKEGYFSAYNKENNEIGFTFFLGDDYDVYTQKTNPQIYKRSENIVKRLCRDELNSKSFLKIDGSWAGSVLQRYYKFGIDNG